MPADSELLGSCGLLLEDEVFSRGEYSLSRVVYRGQKLVAEISSSEGVFQHRWPSVRGLVPPVSARDLPGGRKLLLFDIGSSIFLNEMIRSNGGFTEKSALETIRKVLRIVTDLQAAGMIAGYLGPEMFIKGSGEIRLLAGRRGVPESPFTPPEVGRARPSDPRSDVSAVGSLLFRLIAGTDDREGQLHAWNRLSPPLQRTIQEMVSADPVNRPESLRAAAVRLENMFSAEGEIPSEEAGPVVHSDGFARNPKPSRKSSSRNRFWYFAAPAILAVAYLVFRFSGPPSPGEENPNPPPVPADTSVVGEVLETTVDPIFADSTVTQPLQPTQGVLLEDTAKVWVSNCTGSPDVENRFRAGPLSGFSFVYPITGTSVRRTSLITVRRSDPLADHTESGLWRAAEAIASLDTAFTVVPADLTIMLGTDLSFAGVNAHFLQAPAAPAGTLYVDVVNHGIQYSLEGLGAATYIGGILDGRSCTIDGTEYFISVTDVRDADRYNEEIGIPEVLEETLFIRNRSNVAAGALEQIIRQYVQALPLHGEFPVSDVPVPSLHLLVGSNSGI